MLWHRESATVMLISTQKAQVPVESVITVGSASRLPSHALLCKQCF